MMAKISDLIKDKKQFSFSFEVTPGLSEDSVDRLTVQPLFYSITWHAKTHQNKDLNIGPLEMARNLRKKGKNVMLHLSCDMLRKEFLDKVLIMLQEHSICNLLLVLGEQYDPTTSDFGSTLQLIKYIRNQKGDYFCIGVAGLLDCTDQKLQDLKQKVDAGVNFILTQAFFEPALYKTYLQRCKKIGIDVPIVPGIFYFETTLQLSSFVNICKIKLSDELTQQIENEEKSKNVGDSLTKHLIEDLNKDIFHHFHFFTLNKLESVSNFIKENF